MSVTKAIYDVILPLPMADSYEYNATDQLKPGQLVTVPFGKKLVTGLIWRESPGLLLPERRKFIAQTCPLPPLPADFLQFLLWSARYTMNPVGLILKMALAGTNIPPPPAPIHLWQRAETNQISPRAGSKAAQLLALFNDPARNLSAEALLVKGFSVSEANRLVLRGLLQRIEVVADIGDVIKPDFKIPELTEAQSQAAEAIQKSQLKATTIVLQGVTGAGKTEVYCEAIAATLRVGKQALVLLPEIALTTAMLRRFAARFGAVPTVWHSGLTGKQRSGAWWAITQGRAPLIIGARSALFLPYPNLGLIVVDEEHETSYKQDEGIIYQARDLAVVRARHGDFSAILASATPSLETFVNVQQGRYRLVRLPERYGGASLPVIHRIDMRAENLPANRFISAPLLSAVREALRAGEQSMLFVNRRGYAPLTLCRHCGHRLHCPQCSAWLVQHRQQQRLQCHHCGTHSPMPERCPACQEVGFFAACGPGVERVAEEIGTLLPQARCAVMSSDLLQNPQAITALLAKMNEHEVDILVGTQIMAKGYHFPNLTLVGIIDADLGLSGGDPRASERCFQLLQQVAGRTGRGEKPGRAYLQTYQPDHPVMAALQRNDHDAFMTAELVERQAYDLPPTKRLAAIILCGADLRLVQVTAARICQALPQNERLKVLGPAPAPIALLRGQHRQRLLVITDRQIDLQAVLQTTLDNISLPKPLKIRVDIDPYSFS